MTTTTTTITIEPSLVLSNKDIEFLHNELVARWEEAGYGLNEKSLRAAFILGFGRAVEAAVLSRIGPAMAGEIN